MNYSSSLTGIRENERSCRFSMLMAGVMLVGARQRRGGPHRRRLGPLGPDGAGRVGGVAGVRLEEEAELWVAATALQVA